MRGATQTRKRRVGWQMERTRFVFRYITGKEIALGGNHKGYYTNGQHTALRLTPVLWAAVFGDLIAEMILDFFGVDALLSPGVTSFLLWTQMVFTALFLPCLAVWWLVRRVRAWWQFRGMDEAFAQTIGELLGWPEETKAYLWLHFPINWRKRQDAAIRIEMKYDAANSDEKKKRILEAVASGLGAKVEDQRVTWDVEVRPSMWPWRIVWPSLTVRPTFPPPDVAMFSDHLDLIGKSTVYSDIVPGIGEYGKPYRINIATEFPHGGIYATPGQGKSQILANLGCQAAHNGAVLVVLDPKVGSLPCFHDLPNVIYAGSGEEIHHTLVALEQEALRRAKLLKVPRGQKRPDPGAPVVVLADEADAMEDYLRRTWEQMHGSRVNPPSLAAWRNTRFMGRELKMHQWIVSQSGSAKALGGGDARSALGNRFVSADDSVWGKVAPQYKGKYGISNVPGRWWAMKFGAPVPVQMFGFIDPADGDEELKMDEARLWASSGIVATLPDILQDLKTRLEALPDTPKPNIPEPPNTGGDTPDGPTSGTQVGDTLGHGPHLRVVPSDATAADLEAAEQRRAEWAGRIDAAVNGLHTEPAEERWLTLSEAMEAGVIPEKTINAWRIEARRSQLLEAHKRFRAKPPYAGAKEWPRDVLEQWAREKTNA